VEGRRAGVALAVPDMPTRTQQLGLLILLTALIIYSFLHVE
jgi:hypothetical protein